MDLRKQLLGLAGAAMVFAGAANAQFNCTGLTAGATFIRGEGQTELIPQLTVNGCTAAAAAATLSVSVFLSPAVTVTSAPNGLTPAAPTVPAGSTEAQLQVTGSPAIYYGTVTGSSVTFSGIAIPVGPAPTFVISNVRVNASTIPSVVGSAPTPISAQAFVSGVGVTPGPTNGLAVAYVLNGLAVSKITKDVGQATSGNNVGSPFGVCGSLNNSGTASVSFFVAVNENFSTAFKSKNGTANGGVAGMGYSQESEASNVGLEGGPAATIPNSGTRIKIVFSNVPAGLNIYVPLTVSSNGPFPVPPALPQAAVLTYQISETAPSNGTANFGTAVTSPSSVAAAGSYVQVPAANGSATAVFEVTTDSPALDMFSVPVILQASSNSIVNQSTTMTVQTSFAPVTAATTVPSFVVGSSSTSTNVLSFTLCTTSLLFPFVTNQAGFETGIAIANTSVDPFGSAKPQSGTCTLNYYGTGGTNPTKTTAPNTNETTGAPYGAGETYAFTLTSALAATTGNPATFQGYVIAACNFQFAHGFAYITYAFPGASSDTMGYLALSIPRGATGPESAGQ